MKIERKVAEMLIDTRKTLSLAESCTGGMVTSMLTDISGSSSFLKYTVVAYSYESKVKILKIPQKVLDKHGAVSKEVATLMAKNVRKILNTDYGVAITGVAGPTGGTPKKPVGLVYIAVASKKEVKCLKCMFKGTRTQIRKQSANKALELLIRCHTP
ncbi:MAG: CinA family protein [Candidatus Omnitrophica bacterium]|nr:CinA family protein [Candidatus Omnitrophota bacterium]